jgi:hypothetical protein
MKGVSQDYHLWVISWKNEHSEALLAWIGQVNICLLICKSFNGTGVLVQYSRVQPRPTFHPSWRFFQWCSVFR